MTTHATISLSSSSDARLTPNGSHSGMDITIQNLSDTAYVYIGGEGVNPEDFGYRLAPGAAWSIELAGRDALYAITDVDNSYIAILKTSLESGN
jgi:hypothetical protein